MCSKESLLFSLWQELERNFKRTDCFSCRPLLFSPFRPNRLDHSRLASIPSLPLPEVSGFFLLLLEQLLLIGPTAPPPSPARRAGGKGGEGVRSGTSSFSSSFAIGREEASNLSPPNNACRRRHWLMQRERRKGRRKGGRCQKMLGMHRARVARWALPTSYWIHMLWAMKFVHVSIAHFLKVLCYVRTYFSVGFWEIWAIIPALYDLATLI